MADEDPSTKAVSEAAVLHFSTPVDPTSTPAGRTGTHGVCPVRNGGDIGSPIHPPASFYVPHIACRWLLLGENKVKATSNPDFAIILVVPGPVEAASGAGGGGDVYSRWGYVLTQDSAPCLACWKRPADVHWVDIDLTQNPRDLM